MSFDEVLAVSPTITESQVVIVIPTYRRIAMLTTLLEGLAPQALAAGALIIVGDNACEENVAELVRDFTSRAAIAYLAVSARGVSQVRNALVAEALRLAPDWRWLLMLDDDGQVTPGWLGTMLQCARKHSGDLLGGPVIGTLPAGSSRLAHNSVFAQRTRSVTGPIALLQGAQNLAINRDLLNRLPLPLFENRLGASGGEDYDLFRRVVHSGGRLVWCEDAIVLEPPPAERLTTRPCSTAITPPASTWLPSMPDMMAGHAVSP